MCNDANRRYHLTRLIKAMSYVYLDFAGEATAKELADYINKSGFIQPNTFLNSNGVGRRLAKARHHGVLVFQSEWSSKYNVNVWSLNK